MPSKNIILLSLIVFKAFGAVCTENRINEADAECDCGSGPTKVPAGSICELAVAGDQTSAGTARKACHPNGMDTGEECWCIGTDATKAAVQCNTAAKYACDSTAADGVCIPPAVKSCGVPKNAITPSTAAYTQKCGCGSDKTCAIGEVCETTDTTYLKGTCIQAAGNTLGSAVVYTDKKVYCGNSGTMVVAADKYCVVYPDGSAAIATAKLVACSTAQKTTGDCFCEQEVCKADQFCRGGKCVDTTVKCTNTDGTAINTDGKCACGSTLCEDNKTCVETGADNLATVTGTCGTEKLCSATIGAAITKSCKCGSAAEACGDADVYCDTRTSDAHYCHAAPQCANTDGTVANALETACKCGTTDCAKGSFCTRSKSDTDYAGTCRPACTANAGAATGADCRCGSANCAATSFCVEVEANGAKTSSCIEGKYADLVHAAGAATVTPANKANCASHCEKCADSADDSNSAACIGQFMATMGAAMTSL